MLSNAQQFSAMLSNTLQRVQTRSKLDSDAQEAQEDSKLIAVKKQQIKSLMLIHSIEVISTHLVRFVRINTHFSPLHSSRKTFSVLLFIGSLSFTFIVNSSCPCFTLNVYVFQYFTFRMKITSNLHARHTLSILYSRF